jgi:hypothetical protein
MPVVKDKLTAAARHPPIRGDVAVYTAMMQLDLSSRSVCRQSACTATLARTYRQ